MKEDGVQEHLGLHYHLAGHGSVIRNNDIHHLYFGFYSVGVGGMVIENNKVHDMGHYGIDPHTGTHDMVIRNNTVYGNNGPYNLFIGLLQYTY